MSLMTLGKGKTQIPTASMDLPPSYEIAIRGLLQDIHQSIKPTTLSCSQRSRSRSSTPINGSNDSDNSNNETTTTAMTQVAPCSSTDSNPHARLHGHYNNSDSRIIENAFLSLPRKLHLKILSHVPWPSITAVRLTHSYFAQHILSPKVLVDLHRLHQSETWKKEKRRLREIGQLRQRSWPNVTSGTSRLPCYHCLRWLPSADYHLQTSAFSRLMATNTTYDLAGSLAKNRRICIDCGIKTGLYPRGSIVKNQTVCYACGTLDTEKLPYFKGAGEPIYNPYSDSRQAILRRMGSREGEKMPVTNNVGNRLYSGARLRRRFFCTACIDEGAVPDTLVEFAHDRFWRRYEVGMAKGKAYRLAKGKMLREQRGIKDPELDRLADEYVYEPRHECPFTSEKRICVCWKGKKGPSVSFLTYVDTLPWIW